MVVLPYSFNMYHVLSAASEPRVNIEEEKDLKKKNSFAALI